jgi:hypothetical protein
MTAQRQKYQPAYYVYENDVLVVSDDAAPGSGDTTDTKILTWSSVPATQPQERVSFDMKAPLEATGGRLLVEDGAPSGLALYGSNDAGQNWTRLKKQRRVKVRSRFQPIRAALQTQTTFFSAKRGTFLFVCVFSLINRFWGFGFSPPFNLAAIGRNKTCQLNFNNRDETSMGILSQVLKRFREAPNRVSQPAHAWGRSLFAHTRVILLHEIFCTN